MSQKYEKLAQEIITHLGGEEKFFEVNNEIVSLVTQGGQTQVVIGNHVEKFTML
ncbi:hypothetical protein ACVRZD_02135 [Streptococcus hongkongensis]